MSKTILITGCSSGIGWCAAETLHKKGYNVFATARAEEDLEKLKALGVVSLHMDMQDSASIHAGLSFVLERTGGTLDALFNNAGAAVPGAVEDLTLDMMRKQFETNVFGPMELANLVMPVMRKQGHGRIIQNTSILGVITMPYVAHIMHRSLHWKHLPVHCGKSYVALLFLFPSLPPGLSLRAFVITQARAIGKP